MKKIKLTSNHKNRVLIVIASITVILFLSFAIIVGIQRKNSSTVTPLTEKEVNLSNGSQYAFNGFVLGMPYKEMEKRLKG